MRRRKGLFSRQMKPYLLVILVLLSFFLAISVFILTQLRRQSLRANRETATYFEKVIDEKLERLEDDSYALLYHTAVSRLQDYSAEEMKTKSVLSSAYRLIDYIDIYLGSNSLAEEVCIYYPASDRIVGSRGCYTAYEYFKLHHMDKNPYREEYLLWKNAMFNRAGKGFFTAADPFTGETEAYLYMTSPIIGGRYSRMIVIQISGSEVQKMMRDLVGIIPHDYAALLDGSGRVYASAGDTAVFEGADGKLVLPEEKPSYLSTRISSDVWDLEFFSARKNSSVYLLLSTISVVLAVGIAAATGLALGVSLYYAARRRKQIDQIVQKFDTQLPDTEENEFSNISSHIDILIRENAEVMRAAEKQQQLVEASFLRELLAAGPDARTAEALCDIYQVAFDWPNFALLAAERGGRLPAVKTDSGEFSAIRAALPGRDVILCCFSSGQGQLLWRRLREEFVRNYAGRVVWCSPILSGLPEIAAFWSRAQVGSAEAPDGEAEPRAAAPTAEEKARAILEAEYANPQLSLRLVADRLGVNQSYLSRTFKEQYGIGFLACLNQIRVREAKKLLLRGGDSLKTVALQVGFLSDVSLIRVFKKYENTTPGSFRSGV